MNGLDRWMAACMDALHTCRFVCDLKRVTIEGLIRSTSSLSLLIGSFFRDVLVSGSLSLCCVLIVDVVVVVVVVVAISKDQSMRAA